MRKVAGARKEAASIVTSVGSKPTAKRKMARQTRRYKSKAFRAKARRYKIKTPGLKTGHYIGKFQRRSKMPAAPMPPPIHMVTMP
jgi:hypothetical protein